MRNARSIRTSRSTSPGQASASASAKANNTGRRVNACHDPPACMPRRQASTTIASESISAATSSRRSACSPSAESRRAAGRSSARRAGGGTVERPPRLGHLGRQRRHAGASCGRLRAIERRARDLGMQRTQRQLGGSQLCHRHKRRRQRLRIELRQRSRGLIEPTEQQQAARRDQPRLQRIGAIGPRLQGRCRGGQGPRRTAEIAHRQRHLGLGHDATRPRQFLVTAETAHRTPQQLAGARMIPELSHGDAAQGQGRRIVAQRDPLERT
ncbi:hypothetical protein [Lysobacter antibioticus]|uniref:hypothetical protein n=1 Tax=Lysobacter antibioticus TaxID=84531 RepID=UPI001F2A144E|nr:hypothetical protein [Lysobacter antibioticus]